MNTGKLTPVALQQMKKRREKHTLMVVYDYPLAKILDERGIDAFLVGDSAGTILMGRKDDFSVTVDEMIHYTRAVVQATERALVIADMPFMSYQVNVDEAKRNAGRLVKEGGADAVKLEGGVAMAETIRALVSAGIPVMAHIGILDQSFKLTGLYKIRGRTEEDKDKLLGDAKAVEEAGAFLVGLDSITANAAADITQVLEVPTCGIGAGPHCDGCSLNIYDVIGLTVGFEAKFVKTYVNVRDIIGDAVTQFMKEVKDGTFPDEAHSYH